MVAQKFMDGDFCKQEFQDDYKKHGANGLRVQIPHLARLADVYMKKAYGTSWLNYIKISSSNLVTSSWMARLVDMRIARENQVLKTSWLNYLTAHALLNSCLSRDGNRERWLPKIYQIEAEYYGGRHPWSEKEHREKTDELKNQLIKLRKNVSRRLEPAAKLIEQLDIDNDENPANQKILNQLKEMTFITGDFCTTEMIQLSREVLLTSEAVIGGHIPQYCAVALGSLARGEATPYSDIEYVFLCLPNADTDTLKRVAIDSYFRLNNFGETSLKYMYIDELHDTFQVPGKLDSRWFDDKGKNGFKIDGFLPYSGNIPTGNTLSGRDDFLIRTPDQLYQLYTEHIRIPVNPDTPITGDMSDFLTSTIIIRSKDNGEKLLEDFRCLALQQLPSDVKESLMKKRDLTLAKDRNKFSFEPDYTEFKIDYKQREVKTDIFRFPTLLITGQNREALMNKSSWHALNSQHNERIIDQGQYDNLSVLLTAALHIRLSAYSSFGAQREALSFLTSKATRDSHLNVDKYYFPRPLFIFMAMALMRTRGMKGVNDNKLFKANALLFCGDPTHGLVALREWLDVESLENPEVVITALESRDMSMCIYRLHMISYALAESGDCALSLAYLKQEEKLHQRYGADDFNKAQLKHAMGMNYANIGQYEEAALHYSASLELLQTRGTCRNSLEIASSHHQLGMNYEEMGQYDEAAIHYFISLRIREINFGADSNHPDITKSHHQLGNYYAHIGQGDEAVEHYNISLEMEKAIYGAESNHPNIAGSHHQLGTCYAAMGLYMEALEHFNTCLKMHGQIHGQDTFHLDKAIAHQQLGIVYYELGQLDSAMEHCEISLQMKTSIHGNDTNHPSIASSHLTIADININLGKLKQAEKHLEIALQMLRCVHGDRSCHPNLALAHKCHARIQGFQGNYKKAYAEYLKAVTMMECTFGYQHEQFDVIEWKEMLVIISKQSKLYQLVHHA